MIETLAKTGVLISGLYLIGLGVAALAKPAWASRYLSGFASSAPLHYFEMGVRILIGLAFVKLAPAMLAPEVSLAFGWILVITSAGLALVPWHWHRRFAERAVPQALRYMKLLGVSSLLLGAAVLLAVLRGPG